MPIEARRLLGLLFAGFALLCLALGYIQLCRGDALASDPRNPRLVLPDPAAARGGILARSGEVLADGPAPGRRAYRVRSLWHAIGYTDPRYGTAGLEAVYHRYLAGVDGRSILQNWLLELRNEAPRGADLVTTIDPGLQAAAAAGLGRRKGAVVVLDARTGDVLAMVSRPDPGYPPALPDGIRPQDRNDAPFLNRALYGLYPPGSAFKIATAAAALRAGLGGFATDCRGRAAIAGRAIRDAGRAGHGRLGLERALAVSCNVYFARLGAAVGAGTLTGAARALGLGAAPPFDLGGAKGSLPEVRGRIELLETALGQGRVLVTPMQMALAAAAIANGGLLVRPRIAAALRYRMGPPAVLPAGARRRALTAAEAALLRQYMETAVAVGTARRAAARDWRVGGKTGTAQAPGGKPHAWFVGFASSGTRQLALAAVVEHGGSGGEVAAPIAAAVWRAAAGGAVH
ncbi:MAG: penicillin-binding transpeptidase domain-containing protein [Patescibacteria group bacterium]